MFQYFVKEININKIKPKIINKLKDKFNYYEKNKKILLSKKGYFIIDNDNVTLYKIINKESSKQENFLEKFTLLGNNNIIKKQENISNLPVYFSDINIKKYIFNIVNSNNKMVLELIDNKVINLYFTSKNKTLNENNYFFNNDISLYLKSLNI